VQLKKGKDFRFLNFVTLSLSSHLDAEWRVSVSCTLSSETYIDDRRDLSYSPL